MKNNKTTSGTNVQKVKNQNAQAGNQYANEFAQETDVNEVKRQNQQSEANKNNASKNNQQNR
ncbi:gamma-type small acid-soluble spore protein [Jeotgalibacillus proteolyticus]|uniref:Small, acid-soluble spore protein gamma-type n=1 Tax=Jeotgalibacillus proteolyticus TaxID=2082395 RepID=A0A2S5G7C4_9BACL|nr:gamma-type small acid-soluble spore protein [Jeotgalibacillus proteolyticus]PPA68831.1 gamma-type small acid-soluble spore protein [Jeotgalibacillus proteolyticus]